MSEITNRTSHSLTTTMSNPTNPIWHLSTSLPRPHLNDSGNESSTTSNDSANASVGSKSTSTNIDNQEQQDISVPLSDSPSPVALKRKKGFMRHVTKLYISPIAAPQETIERFRNLCLHLDDPLVRYIRRKRLNAESYGIDLLMLSQHEDRLDRATPWIVISCGQSILKTIRKFFDRTSIKEAYQSDFDLLILDEPIVAYTADHLNVSMLKAENVSTFGAESVESPMIRIDVKDNAHYATLGGFLKLTWDDGTFTFVGLTAGHMLHEDVEEQNIAGSRQADPFIDNRKASYFGKDESADSEESSDEESDRMSEGSRMEYVIDQFPLEERQRTEIGSKRAEFIGRIKTSRYIQNVNHLVNNDWSLVTFETKHRCLEVASLLHGVIPAGAKEAVGWVGLGSKVRIAAGYTGTLEGRLARSTSFIRVPGGNRLVETYSLILAPGLALSPGDCGSWVIDEENGTVYGHVIAGNSLRTAYVLPMEAIMDDIQATNNMKRVKIADLQELSSFFGLGIETSSTASSRMFGQRKEFKTHDDTWFTPGRVFTVRDKTDSGVRFKQYVVLDQNNNSISCLALESFLDKMDDRAWNGAIGKSIAVKMHSGHTRRFIAERDTVYLEPDTVYLEDEGLLRFGLFPIRVTTNYAHHMQIDNLRVRHEISLDLEKDLIHLRRKYLEHLQARWNMPLGYSAGLPLINPPQPPNYPSYSASGTQHKPFRQPSSRIPWGLRSRPSSTPYWKPTSQEQKALPSPAKSPSSAKSSSSARSPSSAKSTYQSRLIHPQRTDAPPRSDVKTEQSEDLRYAQPPVELTFRPKVLLYDEDHRVEPESQSLLERKHKSNTAQRIAPRSKD